MNEEKIVSDLTDEKSTEELNKLKEIIVHHEEANVALMSKLNNIGAALITCVKRFGEDNVLELDLDMINETERGDIIQAKEEDKKLILSIGKISQVKE